jgi:hypothetical protein
VTTLYLYAKNGYWNTTDIEAEYEFMLAVASNEIESIDDIAAWLSALFRRAE